DHGVVAAGVGEHVGGVEHVEGHGLGAEVVEQAGLVVGAGQTRHFVTGGDQLAYGAPPDNTGGAGNEHIHEDNSFCSQVADRICVPTVACCKNEPRRSAIVTLRNASRYASSASYMTRAIPHTPR